MSSVLDALTPEQRAEVLEAALYRRFDREIVGHGLGRLLDLALVRQVVVTAPGAGSEWVQVVPAGATWEILSVRYQFVTSAVVSTRGSRIRFTDQDLSNLAEVSPPSTQTASQNIGYSALAGLGDHNTSSTSTYALPAGGIVLASNWTIRSSTGGLDVGDAYTSIMLVVREWSPSRVAQQARRILADLDSAGGI